VTHRHTGTLKATHAPAGASAQGHRTGRPAHTTPPPWTGITAPAPDCPWCTWAWKDGQFHLKYASLMCPAHAKAAR
jgi:hypothetical protein